MIRGIFIFLFTTAFLDDSVAAKAVQAVVMHNVFYAPEKNGDKFLSPYLEIYWQVNPRTILYKKDNEVWQGKIRTDIIIKNGDEIVNQEHYILETLPVSDGNLTLTQKIIDLKRFALKPGKYSIKLELTDLIKKAGEYIYQDSFQIAPKSNASFFSDVQLVDTSIASSQENIFQRNNVLQIPLCTNFLDDSKKILHYYGELYQTMNISDGTFPLRTKIFISKKELGSPINNLVTYITVRKSLLQIAEGVFSLASLSSGNYFLNLVLEDKDQNTLATKTLFFQLLNPRPVAIASTDSTSQKTEENLPIQTLNLNKTFVGKYTSAQTRAILKMLLPIAEPTEKNSIQTFLKKPDEMYMRYFIYNFWLNRNKIDPEQAWKDYTEKVKYVNKLFGSSLLPGYETDRGHVYIKYGKPTERIVVSNEEGAYPYEIWQYNALERSTDAMFLFYRPGFISNDYKLLHTTVNDEVRNRSWRTSLYSNGVAVDPNNSRAEQYLSNR